MNASNSQGVVLGLSLTGLGVIRSLGRKGITIIGFDTDRKNIASSSRYCTKTIHVDPEKTKIDRTLDKLIELGEGLPQKAVLIPTNDDFVFLVSRNRSLLQPYFLFNLPDNRTIEAVNNKKTLHDLAIKYDIPTPKTFSPIDHTIDAISSKINYPCIIKPKYGYLYSEFNKKAFKVESSFDLIEKLKDLKSYTTDLIVQEIISGSEDQQYSLCVYFDKLSKPIATFTSRKIRQRPIEFGTGTFVESVKNLEIKDRGLYLLSKLNFKGFAEVEFKKDAVDGKYKLIEINTRPWTQINLATRCGVDFPYIYFKDITGERINIISNTISAAKWINFDADFFATFGSPGYITNKRISCGEWIKSFGGKKEFAVFSFDDLKPFLFSTTLVILRHLNKLLRKFLHDKNAGTFFAFINLLIYP